jgi:hypothetical protein
MTSPRPADPGGIGAVDGHSSLPSVGVSRCAPERVDSSQPVDLVPTRENAAPSLSNHCIGLIPRRVTDGSRACSISPSACLPTR